MKKLKWIILLSILALASFTIACKPEDTRKAVNGFSVEASVQAVAGEYFNVESLIEGQTPVNAEGKALEIKYDVTTENGGYVPVVDGCFKPLTAGKYIITFSVGNLKVYVTEVNVVAGPQDPTQLIVTADIVQNGKVIVNNIADAKSEISVVAITNPQDANLTYSVVYKGTAGNATPVPVAVDGDSFVCDEVGYYDLTVTANKENCIEDTYSYSFYARKGYEFGEIESFDSTWAETKKVTGSDLKGMKTVVAEDAGITDRFANEEATLLALPVSKIDGQSGNYYVDYYVNPRMSRDYYVSLAEQGYTHLSVWVYIPFEGKFKIVRQVSQVPHYTEQGGEWDNSKGDSVDGTKTYDGNQWVEARIRLCDHNGQYDWDGSFLSHFDLYKRQVLPLVRIYYNGTSNVFPDDANVYVGEVFASKTGEAINFTKKLTDIKRNEVTDLTEYVDVSSVPEGVEMLYQVFEDGKWKNAEEGKFVFQAKFYKVRVMSKSSHYITSVESDLDLYSDNVGVTFDDTINVKAKLGEDVDTFKLYQYYYYAGEKLSRDITEANANMINASGVADISGLEGMYKLEATGVNGAIYYANFEKASKDASGNINFVWGEYTEEAVKKSRGYNEGGAINSKVTVSVEDSWINLTIPGNDIAYRETGIALYPIHSQDYYRMFYSDSTDAQFSFELKGSSVSIGAYYFHKWLGDGGVHTVTLSSTPVQSPYSVSLKAMVETYWEQLISAGSGVFFGWIKNAPNQQYELSIGNFGLTKAKYATEIYMDNNDGNGYVLNEEISEVSAFLPYGEQISIQPAIIEGYNFVKNYQGNVLSGVNNGKLVLKLYYKVAKEVLSTVKTGIITDNILNVGATNLDASTIAVYQYVVKNAESGYRTLEFTEGASFKAVAIDVTEKYKSLFNVETGDIDVSSLDGIFAFSAENDTNTIEIVFERTNGSFVYNNLPEDQTLAGVGGATYYGRKATSATSNGAKFGVADSSDAVMSGKTGLYYTLSSNFGKEIVDDTSYQGNGDGTAVKIYPTHSKEYFVAYETANANTKLGLDWHVKVTDKDGNVSTLTGLSGDGDYYLWDVGRGFGTSGRTYKPGNTWNNSTGWRNENNFILLSKVIENWDSLVGTSNSSISFISSHFKNNARALIAPYNFTLYFGNVHVK